MALYNRRMGNIKIIWQDLLKKSIVSFLCLTIILMKVSSTFARQNMEMTGYGRISPIKTKENFQVFSTDNL